MESSLLILMQRDNFAHYCPIPLGQPVRADSE
jgi:hypothetical protein